MNAVNALLNDEAGFVVSAELVLIATICVLGLIVGLSEVALNINNELEDVGSAFTCLSQSYNADGTCGHKGWTAGGGYRDEAEFCDGPDSIR
jgi:Flp pilus assembly pilin Flp